MNSPRRVPQQINLSPPLLKEPLQPLQHQRYILPTTRKHRSLPTTLEINSPIIWNYGSDTPLCEERAYVGVDQVLWDLGTDLVAADEAAAVEEDEDRCGEGVGGGAVDVEFLAGVRAVGVGGGGNGFDGGFVFEEVGGEYLEG